MNIEKNIGDCLIGLKTTCKITWWVKKHEILTGNGPILFDCVRLFTGEVKKYLLACLLILHPFNIWQCLFTGNKNKKHFFCRVLPFSLKNNFPNYIPMSLLLLHYPQLILALARPFSWPATSVAIFKLHLHRSFVENSEKP